MCVSPLSVDWVCKKASWSQQCQGYPNVCSLPQEEAGPEAAELYGQCIFSSVHQHSLALADELLAAARSIYSQKKVRYSAAWWIAAAVWGTSGRWGDALGGACCGMGVVAGGRQGALFHCAGV